MKINERGYWENNTTEGHGHDEGLSLSIANFLLSVNANSVIDIGCGNGHYVKKIRDNGIDCYGYDGNPHTEEITNGLCEIADFSVPQYLGIYDWVLSLEVGEHIPKQYETTFIDNLHVHNKYGMIISWSIPEYGGAGHVNPKPNRIIIDEIRKLGYSYNLEETNKIRNSAAKYPTPCYWFSETLFVFDKEIKYV